MPFGVTIPEGDRDRRLMIKLTAEWPGILRRLVQGCLSWQRNGLDIPAIVRGASAAYLGAESNLEMFYATCCVQEREASVPAKELWDAYDSWTQQFGVPRESPKVFGAFFTRQGHISKNARVKGTVEKHRFGLRLCRLPGQGT